MKSVLIKIEKLKNALQKMSQSIFLLGFFIFTVHPDVISQNKDIAYFTSDSPLMQLNFTTAPIEIYKNGNRIGSASGFFFKNDEKRYLITNRHVVIREKEKVYPDKIVIKLHTSKLEIKDFKDYEINLYKDGAPIWLEHPDFNKNKCDVIMIELSENILQDYFIKSFSAKNFMNNRIFETIPDVLVIGYPLGFYDSKNCLPIYRKGTIASAYGHYFNDSPFFLIDANLHPGTSGSPVINSSNNTLKSEIGSFTTNSAILLGIQSAEYYKNEVPLGLNVVWYAELLAEIINLNRN